MSSLLLVLSGSHSLGRVEAPPATLKGVQAYERLRREIISCRIFPGTRFTETELMERFGFGKASCRIALQRLSEAGLVTSMPRHGYRVVPVTMKDVEEIFALRLQLEPYATRLAAGKINRRQLERLETACRMPMRAEISNQIDFFLEANRSFHMAIAVSGGNNRLCRALSVVLDEMTRLVALGFGVQNVRPNIDDDHRQLIDLLDRGDADAAERVARRHIETFRSMTLEKVVESLRHSDTQLPSPGIGRTGVANR